MRECGVSHRRTKRRQSEASQHGYRLTWPVAAAAVTVRVGARSATSRPAPPHASSVPFGAGSMVLPRPALLASFAGRGLSPSMDDAIGRGVLRCDYRDVGASIRYVALSGEADLATADQLEDDLRRLLAPSWVLRLALDLTALRHLDCAALAALLAVREPPWREARR
ncbi:STAS domain-containing protein [Micromonospora sp. NPDC051006]|uniref:STAS domain-containing protein n=1 Tax=Micromonospora sp. NPDC051006 TaxID=3364283 RepID=UPI00379D8248